MRLQDPFAIALPVLHGAPGSAAALYWRPGALAGSPIRVIRSRKTEDMLLNDATVPVETELAQIMRSDVDRPSAGARLDIVEEESGATLERFAIAGVPRLDVEAGSWSVELLPA